MYVDCRISSNSLTHSPVLCVERLSVKYHEASKGGRENEIKIYKKKNQMPQAASQKTRQQQPKSKRYHIKTRWVLFFVPIYFPLLMSVCFILENVCTVKGRRKEDHMNLSTRMTWNFLSNFLRNFFLDFFEIKKIKFSN